MRSALLAAVLLGVMVVNAQAQPPLSPKPVSAFSFQDSRWWTEVPLSRQIPQARPPFGRPHTCCNLKHVLIGAGVGAGLGLMLSFACDGGDCAWERVKAMALVGGIGAGIGAFASRSGPGVPFVPVPSNGPSPRDP